MKSEKEQPTTAPEWIAQLAEGEVSTAQNAALTDWLRESPKHVREFMELTLLRADLTSVPLTEHQVNAWVREARETVATPISPDVAPSGFTHPPAKERSARRPRIWAIAASITLALITAAGYQWWKDGRYTTGFGEQKIVTLADGSVVTLNTSSELKVEFTDNKRALKLIKGEAFFRVAHEAARAFEVLAPDATVKALGTQFNVRIAPHQTVVSVVDGVVEVKEDRASASEKALQLRKGEEARIERDPLANTTTIALIAKAEGGAPVRAAAWTRGRVEFEATPLIDVLSEFQRYRQFRVEVAAPLRDLQLTGSFDAQDPEAVFAYIATLAGVTVEKPAPQVFVVREK